ncbi:MAG TPA: hypothetical protein VII62_03770 [Vicinamibacteria bacterium]
MATLTLDDVRFAPSEDLTKQGMWLVSRGYDLAFIIFSSAFVVFPHLSYAVLGKNIYVDLTVTLLIGGPHMFATYTMTFMEPRFRERWPRYTLGALLLPPLIVSLAVLNMTLLVTIFFLWASVHVIHQVAYVTDAYRMKDPRGWDWTGRVIDYGLLATAMYPIATEKFIRGEFQTGGRTLLFPEFLKHPWVAWPVWTVFIGFALAFAWKSVREYREGRLHFAKTLLIVVASVLFFLTPTLANLDVAFQGLNTWHSFQYLAIVLYLNRYRAARGMIGSPFVTKVSHRGITLYAMCLGFTLLTALLYFGVLSLAVGAHLFETGNPFKMLLFGHVYSGQHFFAFYSVILSFLLIHYYFDHFIFLQRDRVITPNFANP